jgi:hypothetical protein
MSIDGLMTVPRDRRDAQWLAHSLQEAIQLEWSTIPPYLCAYWSINISSSTPSTTVDIANTIWGIVVQEMLHMALTGNILAGIGGTPNIYSKNFTPRYPCELPGQVHPGLSVGLTGLSVDWPGNKSQVRKFMEIELPEHPLALRDFSTIGEFYDALSHALDHVNPSFSSERQLTHDLMPDLVWIQSVDDAKAAINLIKRQGEGTSSSPFVDGSEQTISPAHELAHYYRFGEINAEKRLAVDASSPTYWSFSGARLPFPSANDLFLMAEVPPTGYPESVPFDQIYTSVLKLLHDAWAIGANTKLDAAVTAMDNELRAAALTLLSAGHSTGSGQGIKGPDFRFLP